jgi:hypothetical protein
MLSVVKLAMIVATLIVGGYEGVVVGLAIANQVVSTASTFYHFFSPLTQKQRECQERHALRDDNCNTDCAGNSSDTAVQSCPSLHWCS